jgi:hypothetical protein
VLALFVGHTSFACAVTKPLAIPEKEINSVLMTISAVGDSVLTSHAGLLHKQPALFRVLNCSAHLFY